MSEESESGQSASGAGPGARDRDLDDLLALALAAAEEAGGLLLEQSRPWARRDLDVRTKSSATDAVTAMDLAAERAIAALIRSARPDDAFLAEEGTQTPREEAVGGTTWVIDPLDGTVNYLYGLPHWAVSIAAQRAGRTLVGVVHVPVLGETYGAVRGRGAVLRAGDEQIRLGPIDAPVSLGQALIATGFGYARQRRQQQAGVVAALLPQVRDIRRLGAAAVDLCQVAAGRVDAFYELGLQPWDLAAGALIVEEAGGRIEGLTGGPPGVPFNRGMVIAARPGLFDAVHAALVAAKADPAMDSRPPVLPEQPTVP